MRELLIDKLKKTQLQSFEHEGDRNKVYQSQVFLLNNILPAIPDNYSAEDLPRLVPPYEDCWFEWDFSMDWGDQPIVPDTGNPENMNRLFRMGDESSTGIHVNTIQIDDGWIVAMRTFFAIRGNIMPTPYESIIRLNSNGYFAGINSRLLLDKKDKGYDDIAKGLWGSSASFHNFTVVLYALGLLNCKNITTVERGGPIGPSKRNRRHKWSRRHKLLQIRPLRQVRKTVRDAQPSEESEAQVSLHFCRGHFKTYTEEKPLLGRHVGTYWWDAQARGAAQKGIVTKTYIVQPPEDEQAVFSQSRHNQ